MDLEPIIEIVSPLLAIALIVAIVKKAIGCAITLAVILGIAGLAFYLISTGALG